MYIEEGLPDEDPLRGETFCSLDLLGHVSSKGTVVISFGWAFHAKNVGQIVVELFAGHHTTRRRWVRGHQSYHEKSSLGTGWVGDEGQRIEANGETLNCVDDGPSSKCRMKSYKQKRVIFYR
jgi:hypothetical protein